MHYGDRRQTKASEIQIIIYKHGTSLKSKFDYQICSVYKCKHVHPHNLVKLYYQFELMFTEILKKIDAEHFYLFTLSFDGYDVKHKSHKKISKADFKKDPLLGLH